MTTIVVMLDCSACTIAVEAATSRCKLAAIGELRSGEFAKLPSIGSALAADLTWSNAAVLYMYRCDTSIVEGTLQASNHPELATILTDQFIGPGGAHVESRLGTCAQTASVEY